MRDGTADVVVVGAGVIGASVAWHLAALGVRDVLVVDRGAAPGEGSTGRATGGFRAQFGTSINVRLSLLAREKLRRFRDEVGADPGYRACGYLWLARAPGELDILRTAQRVQHEAGLAEARMVEPPRIAELNPAASLDGVIGGAFCPSDGFLRPLDLLRGYLDGARRLGARVRLGEEVTALPRRPGGRIEKVRLAGGEIACGTVVNAAGAWAGTLGRLAGVEVPVAPLRRQVACTAPCPALPEDMPMTLWPGDGFHLRVRDGRVLLLRPTKGAADPFRAEVEDAWIDEVRSIAADRVPALAGVELLGRPLRDVARRARAARPRGRLREPGAGERLLRARRHARSRAGGARGRADRAWRAALARRAGAPADPVRGRRAPRRSRASLKSCFRPSGR